MGLRKTKSSTNPGVNAWAREKASVSTLVITNSTQLLVTTTSTPRVFTLYSSKGLGGGPPIFFPLKLYCPLWHAHQICLVSSRYWTMHSRCVHTAENALNSPVAV